MPGFLSIFKKMDMSGTPVQLTYRGEDKFKTVAGGCTTLVLMAIILGPFGLQMWSNLADPTYVSSTADLSLERGYLVPIKSSMIAGRLEKKD